MSKKLRSQRLSVQITIPQHNFSDIIYFSFLSRNGILIAVYIIRYYAPFFYFYSNGISNHIRYNETKR